MQMAGQQNARQNVSSPLPQSTPRSMYITNLNPIKRKLDRIETERVYRVVQRCSCNFLQVKFLSLLIEDDARLFRITDEELRGLVLNHQQLAGSSNVEIDLLKESTKSIIRYSYYIFVKYLYIYNFSSFDAQICVLVLN